MTVGRDAQAPSLGAEPARPVPAQAQATSRRSAVRRARRVFRPRRSVAAGMVAGALAVAGILVAVQAISAAFGNPVWRTPGLTGTLQNTRWNDPAPLTAAAAAALIGLVLLLAGLLPGRPHAIPLASGEESVVIGVTRPGLRRALTLAAQHVDGVTRARVRLRPRGVVVRATTRLRDPAGLDENVHAAVQDRLNELDPLSPMRIKVRIRQRTD